MPGVSKEQVEQARQIDLLSYLQATEPDNLRRVGGEYCLKDHDSLRISNGLWNWHSRKIGGRSALDFLIKVRGHRFVDAVQQLCGSSVAERPATAPARPARKPATLRLLPPAENNDRAIAYLQSRGIGRALIDRCISGGLLYEGLQYRGGQSQPYHQAVFVGHDPAGTARYGFARSLGGSFKQDLPGSHKRFGFSLPPVSGESAHLAVFEGAIDALSHLELTGEDCHRLSLGGTSPAALLQYLKQHPEIDSVALCLDNDVPGHAGMAAIESLQLHDDRVASVAITRELPPVGNDYNQALQSIRKAERTQAGPDHPRMDGPAL